MYPWFFALTESRMQDYRTMFVNTTYNCTISCHPSYLFKPRLNLWPILPFPSYGQNSDSLLYCPLLKLHIPNEGVFNAWRGQAWIQPGGLKSRWPVNRWWPQTTESITRGAPANHWGWCRAMLHPRLLWGYNGNKRHHFFIKIHQPVKYLTLFPNLSGSVPTKELINYLSLSSFNLLGFG